MSARQKPLHREVASFVQYHLGKDCFAPMTGQDWPAWRAFVYLVECYSHGGGDHAVRAMHATVGCAQSHAKVLRTFVQAIPAVMDWSTVKELWPRVADGVRLHDMNQWDARQLTAIERSDHHPARLHGWQPRDFVTIRNEIEGPQ